MFIAGNWKMNMGLESAQAFLTEFKKLVKEDEKPHFMFFPPAYLSFLFQKEGFFWGGQNVHSQAQGAFTGENSASVLKEMGANFCLIGHSERRLLFGESDSTIERKFFLAQKQALIPLLCIGESLEHRFDKKKLLIKSLSWIKNYVQYDKMPFHPELLPPKLQKIPFIVAYEPIWAIGTGDTPSSEEMQEVAGFLKEYLPSMKLFYGGSVHPDSVKNLPLKALDGFLVGGASLKAKTLYELYQQVRS